MDEKNEKEIISEEMEGTEVPVEQTGESVSAEENVPDEKLPEENNSEEKKGKKKKKKNPFLRFLSGIFWFLIILILIPVIWLTVNAFIKTDILDSVPSDYSVHLRTDSVWDAVNPLLDLQAADLLLSEPALASSKEILMDFRQSPLRSNKYVGLALSRRMDFMLYEGTDFIAVLDTGFLAGAFKLVPYILDYVKIKKIPDTVTVEKSDGQRIIRIEAGELVIKVLVRKNLVFVASSENLFEKILMGGNRESFTAKKQESFEGTLSSAFSISADARKLLAMAGDNNYVKAVSTCIPEDEPATLEFGITDHNLSLLLNAPFSLDSLDEKNPAASLLKRKSGIPGIIQKFPAPVQYYTVIALGSLKELKETAFFAADKSLDLETKWKTAQNLSNAVFHENLENLLFSWTDDEYIVFGIENKAEPVFAIKIKDENRRQKVFDTLFKSIILQNDTSLILDNVRLPRMELPSFLQSLLEAFNIHIPSPYYMVKNGYIYLSQSPENLAAVNASVKNGTRLSQNQTWKEISEKFSQETSLSLFYNLERSIPFFLKSKSAVSKILELYNVGRFDLRINENILQLSLSAVECETSVSSSVSGYPVNPEGKITSELYKSNISNSRIVFYSMGNKVIARNMVTGEQKERVIDGLKFIDSAFVPAKTAKDIPALWAVTGDGTVYLLDENLKDPTGFPLFSGYVPSSAGKAGPDGLVFNARGQKVIKVSSSGKVISLDTESFDDISSEPVISEKFTVHYERSFLGGIHLMDNRGELKMIPVPMGFGTPDVMKRKDSGNEIIGFLSQSGEFTAAEISVSEDGQVIVQESFENLEGVFYLNVKVCGESFVALSEDGTLYSIRLFENDQKDPLVVKVKLPYVTGRSGVITICDFDKDGTDEVFVCGDGNTIYGFRENLEMIGAFPVSGYGKPLFMDLDGDGKNECICTSLDNKINGWRISY